MSKATQVVLVQPPVSLDEIYGGLAKVGAHSPPLNLLLLAAIARKQGFNVHVVDSPARGLGIKETVKSIAALNPDIVGITAMTPHIVMAGKLSDAVRESSPDAKIILGGAHVTSMPEETMTRLKSVDTGFIGEADNSFREYLADIGNQNFPENVKGVIYRRNGGLVRTQPRVEKVNLDAQPLYAWDILEGFPGLYPAPLFASHRRPATPILTSRGCPGKCIYCFSGCNNTISTYSAEYILDMLKYLKTSYGIREFMIYDDNFVMFKDNLKKLLNLLISEKMEMSWSCNARVNLVNEEILHLMKRAGCWQISYGIETGSAKIMDLLKKNIRLEQVTEALRATRKAGLRSVGYFMIGHFCETEETIMETINFACNSDLDDFRMSFFTPLPGTESYGMAVEYGDFENDWSKMTLFNPIFVPKGLTKEILLKYHKMAMRKFFLRPGIIYGYLKMVRNPSVIFKGAYNFGRYIFN